MKDAELVSFVAAHRVFAVVRARSAETALRAAEAAIMGGIKLIEVTLGTPGSFRVISDLLHRYGDRVCVGAGSVTTHDQLDRAIKSGGQFISMPHTSATLIESCRRSLVAPVVGALTPTEVVAAWSMGVPLVSLFPASSLGGPEYVAALTSRIGDLRLVVSGGVGSENIVDYFNAGAYAIAVGGRLFTKGDLKNDNYAAIAERARGLVRLAGVA
ncbi:MAG TPA: bifunctional 4-hydroxy-2-oxoglutarate aldolase/2-dehydro-3-deoxy-phosphogluconate aldolase [Blastocatellia bacterium]|nr:bifunctional 4-hydroxy-2-oxoglutarate aldolase/2-dehydro-3-deoxy-phosphogluconate aldolase [Blastocatellia bacterium]